MAPPRSDYDTVIITVSTSESRETFDGPVGDCCALASSFLTPRLPGCSLEEASHYAPLVMAGVLVQVAVKPVRVVGGKSA
jgi:hypothetical protein